MISKLMQCNMYSLKYTLVTSFLILFVHTLTAQVTGDFRSKTSGQWGNTTTWETFDGTVWNAFQTVPSKVSQVVVLPHWPLVFDLKSPVTWAVKVWTNKIRKDVTKVYFSEYILHCISLEIIVQNKVNYLELQYISGIFFAPNFHQINIGKGL